MSEVAPRESRREVADASSLTGFHRIVHLGRRRRRSSERVTGKPEIEMKLPKLPTIRSEEALTFQNRICWAFDYSSKNFLHIIAAETSMIRGLAPPAAL